MHPGELPALPLVVGDLLGQAGGKCGDGFVGGPPSIGECPRAIEHVELLGDVTGTDADDEPSAGVKVEGGELLGSPQRVPLGEVAHVAEQSGARGDPRQPAERRHGVVPDRTHGIDESVRDGGVVADPEVERARLVGGHRDLSELVDGCRGLPGRHVEARLALDGELESPGDGPDGDAQHDVSWR